MKISTKGRYGLRALIDLAIHGKSGLPVFLSDIAKRQEISDKYLEQIATQLQRGGLVRTIRGRKGGYLLSRPEGQIKLSEIITVLEGPFCLVDCVKEPGTCAKSGSCSTRDIWTELSDKIEEVLASYTLEDIVAMESAKSGSEGTMYYI
jgi:Rrf2 family transcriptional regulator, cysteine metabolism repressor